MFPTSEFYTGLSHQRQESPAVFTLRCRPADTNEASVTAVMRRPVSVKNPSCQHFCSDRRERFGYPIIWRNAF